MTGINIDTYSPLFVGLKCDMILNFTRYIHFVISLCNRTNKFYYMKNKVSEFLFIACISMLKACICMSLFSNDKLFIPLEIEQFAC
jgi:hypothetical protein